MRVKGLLSAALKVSLLLYPVYVWWAINHWHPATALLPIASIALLKSFTGDAGLASRGFFLLTCLGLVLAMLLGQSEHAMLYYPVWMNAGMLSLFGYSLRYPPTVVERIAKLMDGELDEKAIAYTRKVTQVWCVFFLLNGSIAFVTAVLGNWDLWLLYNGLIAYVLMGLLMFIEWQVRRVVKTAK
ncbi:DNA gyrase subunit B [Rheinheimera sp. D18]|uniref:COG4648 family protein n=1 Tax=Rheinheimera sp. D18 TaxID=2545632 RepID=UPI00104ECD50|nr:hypothetical protein [Rheinheimera sp. D18]QBL10698.1 DNA gyrase subunit B [Rheinheimera sp. D18]